MLRGWPADVPAEPWNRMYLGLVLDTAVVSCEIDGVPVRNPERYRVQSPAVPFFLPENNFKGEPPGESA